MSKPTIPTVAVIGSGVIGRSWTQVFARAGCLTRMYDKDRAQLKKALDWLEREVEMEKKDGLINAEIGEARLSRITVHDDPGKALAGAGYIQENGPEDMEVKKSIYHELDEHIDPRALVGSSTSTLDISAVTSGLKCESRCFVAHPVNPPHIVPVVEILAGKNTDPRAVSEARAFLAGVGQTPVLLKFYLPGFLLNRMQVALIREAINLVECGVADVEDVDAVVRDGLGLRWALMGPFGVANTNADGGVREYFNRYKGALLHLMNDLGPSPSFSPEMIERASKGTEAMTGNISLTDIRSWRDRMIRKIRQLKGQNPLT